MILLVGPVLRMLGKNVSTRIQPLAWLFPPAVENYDLRRGLVSESSSL
jgi:hypothetical protein